MSGVCGVCGSKGRGGGGRRRREDEEGGRRGRGGGGRVVGEGGRGEGVVGG